MLNLGKNIKNENVVAKLQPPDDQVYFVFLRQNRCFPSRDLAVLGEIHAISIGFPIETRVSFGKKQKMQTKMVKWVQEKLETRIDGLCKSRHRVCREPGERFQASEIGQNLFWRADDIAEIHLLSEIANFLLISNTKPMGILLA